jgi:hypothetical protein
MAVHVAECAGVQLVEQILIVHAAEQSDTGIAADVRLHPSGVFSGIRS